MTVSVCITHAAQSKNSDTHEDVSICDVDFRRQFYDRVNEAYIYY